MRTALNVGERILQSSAMAIPDKVVVSPSLNLAFGTLTLTSQRLLFEPDRLSIRTKEVSLALSEITDLSASWTQAFKTLPIWPTLVVQTRFGTSFRFAAVRLNSLGPRRWIAAIGAAQAASAGVQPATVVDAGSPAGPHAAEGIDPSAASSAPSHSEAAVWYYEQDGSRVGPVTRAVLDHNRAQGLIGPQTRISEAGGPWQAAATLDTAPEAGAARNVPPPLPPDNRFAWAIVAVPLVGALVEFLFGSELGFLYLVANILLCLWDRRRLEEAGYSTPSGWWVLLIPVYLWKRATLLGQRQVFAGAWLAAFVASLLLASWGHRETLADSACPLVTQIISEQLNGSATCKGVEIVRDVGNGFYVGKATLDNGRELTITIEDKGKNIEVRIPRP